MIKKIYLDMDGVLCDFHGGYRRLWNSNDFDREEFRASVLKHKIFEHLDKLPDADVLLNYVRSLDGVEVEMLTSVGTFRVDQGAAAKEQKTNWLLNHGILFKPNFSRNKEEKANFATPDSVLIDDSIGCVDPFRAKGGKAILHVSAESTITQLKALGVQ